jgi:hypothetical protein
MLREVKFVRTMSQPKRVNICHKSLYNIMLLLTLLIICLISQLLLAQ